MRIEMIKGWRAADEKQILKLYEKQKRMFKAVAVCVIVYENRNEEEFAKLHAQGKKYSVRIKFFRRKVVFGRGIPGSGEYPSKQQRKNVIF